MGTYFILKLNYPVSSEKSSREYKWTPEGTWKKYDEELKVLLVKEEYREEVETTDGIKIKDSNGKEVIYKDHYYFVSNITDALSENLFMRWGNKIPSKPVIKLNTVNATRKVEASIEYDEAATTRLYKLVYANGDETDWLDYKGPIKIDRNKTIIYAKGITSAEVEGDISSLTVTNIDEVKPEISIKGNLTELINKVTLQINAKR